MCFHSGNFSCLSILQDRESHDERDDTEIRQRKRVEPIGSTEKRRG